MLVRVKTTGIMCKNIMIPEGVNETSELSYRNVATGKTEFIEDKDVKALIKAHPNDIESFEPEAPEVDEDEDEEEEKAKAKAEAKEKKEAAKVAKDLKEKAKKAKAEEAAKKDGAPEAPEAQETNKPEPIAYDDISEEQLVVALGGGEDLPSDKTALYSLYLDTFK